MPILDIPLLCFCDLMLLDKINVCILQLLAFIRRSALLELITNCSFDSYRNSHLTATRVNTVAFEHGKYTEKLVSEIYHMNIYIYIPKQLETIYFIPLL